MLKAAVTGTISAENATKYAKNAKYIDIDEKEIARYKADLFAPLTRRSGYTTEHVTTRLQQVILPYDVRIVMHRKRLESAITMIEFFRDHFLPKIIAKDTHDLRNAHEVINMVQGAEVQLKTALTRTESRGTFYREDYPYRDDENWLKWIVAQHKNGTLKIWTEDVQFESHGDKTKPYEERYILEYPR